MKLKKGLLTAVMMMAALPLLVGGSTSKADDKFDSTAPELAGELAPKLAGDEEWMAPSPEPKGEAEAEAEAETKSTDTICESYEPLHLDDFLRIAIPVGAEKGLARMMFMEITGVEHADDSTPSLLVKKALMTFTWKTASDDDGVFAYQLECTRLYPSRKLSFDGRVGFLVQDGEDRSHELKPTDEETQYQLLFSEDYARLTSVLFRVYNRKVDYSEECEGEVELSTVYFYNDDNDDEDEDEVEGPVEECESYERFNIDAFVRRVLPPGEEASLSFMLSGIERVALEEEYEFPSLIAKKLTVLITQNHARAIRIKRIAQATIKCVRFIPSLSLRYDPVMDLFLIDNWEPIDDRTLESEQAQYRALFSDTADYLNDDDENASANDDAEIFGEYTVYHSDSEEYRQVWSGFESFEVRN